DLVEHEDDSLLGRHLFENSKGMMNGVFAAERTLGRILGGELIGITGGRGLTPLPGAEAAQRHVDGQSIEPRGELRLQAEPSDRAPDLEEDLLNRVLDVTGADQTVKLRRNLSPVGEIELIEGTPVAFLTAQDGLFWQCESGKGRGRRIGRGRWSF